MATINFPYNHFPFATLPHVHVFVEFFKGPKTTRFNVGDRLKFGNIEERPIMCVQKSKKNGYREFHHSGIKKTHEVVAGKKDASDFR